MISLVHGHGSNVHSNVVGNPRFTPFLQISTFSATKVKNFAPSGVTIAPVVLAVMLRWE